MIIRQRQPSIGIFSLATLKRRRGNFAEYNIQSSASVLIPLEAIYTRERVVELFVPKGRQTTNLLVDNEGEIVGFLRDSHIYFSVKNGTN